MKKNNQYCTKWYNMNKVEEIGDSIVANVFVDFVPLIQVKGRFTLIFFPHFNPSRKNIAYFEDLL